MDNENNLQIPAESVETAADPTAAVDNDVMLPDDYVEGQPYSFEVPDDAPDDTPAPLPDEETTGTEEEKELQSAPASDQPATGEDPAAPESTPANDTYKFTDTVQGLGREVEIPLTDIPGLYRKAQTADFIVRRTGEYEGRARALGYESVEDMLAKVRSEKIEREVAELMDDHVHETIARDVVSRKYPEYAPPIRQQTPQQTRNIESELNDLFTAYPAMRGQKLPQEVTNAVMGGKSVLAAYKDYVSSQNNDELARLRKENETLRQNAAAAARAPVKSVTAGGSTDPNPEDDFLRGFNRVYR